MSVAKQIDIVECSKYLLQLGLKFVVVTSGNKGASVFTLDNYELKSYNMKVVSVEVIN